MLAGGAFMVALAAGLGGGAALSNATPPTPVVPLAPVVAPPLPPPDTSGVPAPPANNKVSGGRNYLIPSEIRD